MTSFDYKISRFFTISRLIFWRQMKVYQKGLGTMVINYLILWPLLSSLRGSYLAPLMYFGPGSGKKATIILTGNILFQLMILSTHQAMDLIRDDVLSYHVIGGSIWGVIIGRTCAASCFITPFCVGTVLISKYFFGMYFGPSALGMLAITGFIFLGALLFMSVSYALALYLYDFMKVSAYWMRVYMPLLFLGGLWNPLFIMKKAIPSIGYFSVATPFLYVTEGIRQAVISGPEYFSLMRAGVGVIGWAIFFQIILSYLMKKNLDTI